MLITTAFHKKSLANNNSVLFTQLVCLLHALQSRYFQDFVRYLKKIPNMGAE